MSIASISFIWNDAKVKCPDRHSVVSGIYREITVVSYKNDIIGAEFDKNLIGSVGI